MTARLVAEKANTKRRRTDEEKPTRRAWLVRGGSPPPSLWSTAWPGACRRLRETTQFGGYQTRMKVGEL